MTRIHLAGFPVASAIRIGGAEEGIAATQRFVDDPAYRAARRGSLIVDRVMSRRRYEGWGAWAQERIRVRFCSLGARCTPQRRLRATVLMGNAHFLSFR